MLNQTTETNLIHQIAEGLDKKRKNEEYMKSPEWLEFVKKNKKVTLNNYTVIYRDTNGELSEDWHFIAEFNIDFVKEKYTKSNKEVLYFVLKELPFGDFLKKITESSKDSR